MSAIKNIYPLSISQHFVVIVIVKNFIWFFFSFLIHFLFPIIKEIFVSGQIYVIAVLLPLFAFLLVLSFGNVLGQRGAIFLTSFGMFLVFFISFYGFVKIGLEHMIAPIAKLYRWVDYMNFQIDIEFLFDSVSITMMFVVSLISFLVHFYSIGYMNGDPHKEKFFGFLSLFTFFMLVLVTANNFVQLFFGWEGVGIASYLSINFWNTRLQANKSAIKAIIFNRIGDAGIMLAIGLIFSMFSSLSFDCIFACIDELLFEEFEIFGKIINLIDVVAFLLFLGVSGKSAQFGLHNWLPDAMEGPTPVSALIHAATMVTAGVFLLIRCSVLFDRSELVLNLIAIIGSLTAFFAASVALFQNDLKRIIAYSTCSQSGYMISVCSISAYNVALFHLVTHAFFKALLFLGAGAIIHSLDDEQDIRRMGGLIRIFPFYYMVMLIGSLSLMGFPFLSGYYSKEFIMLSKLASATTTIELFSSILLIASAISTAAYSVRLVWFVFFGPYNGYRGNLRNVHYQDKFIVWPLLILALLSIFGGYLLSECFIGIGSDFFVDSLFIKKQGKGVIDFEFYSASYKLMPFVLTCFASFFTFVFYKYGIIAKMNFMFLQIYKFFNNKWHIDVLYEKFIIRPILQKIMDQLLFNTDRGFLEYFGSTGLVRIINRVKNGMKFIYNGMIQNYLYVGVIYCVSFSLIFYLFGFSVPVLIMVGFGITILVFPGKAETKNTKKNK